MIDYEILLSVIIPVYKTPKSLLRQMMESVQRLPMNVEIICVLDSPGDLCEKELDRIAYEDARIKVLKNDMNYGETWSRNRALSVLKGRFFTCVDADDRIEVEAYIEAIDLLEQKGFDICAVGMEGDGKTEKPRYQGAATFNFDSVLLQVEMSSCGLVVRTSSLKSRGITYPNGLINNGDFVFSTRMLWSGMKSCAIKRVGYFIVGQPNSVSRSPFSAQRFFSSAKALRMIADVIADKQLSSRVIDFYASRMFYSQLCCYACKNLPELIQKEPHIGYLEDIQYVTSKLFPLFRSRLNPAIVWVMFNISKEPKWLLLHYRLTRILLRSGCLRVEMWGHFRRFFWNRLTFR